MNIDFNQKIFDATGAPVRMTPDSQEDATLASFASTALFTPLESDQRLDGLAKAQIGELGLRVFPGGMIEITPEEATLIRERCAKCFGPLHVARIFALTKGD